MAKLTLAQAERRSLEQIVQTQLPQIESGKVSVQPEDGSTMSIKAFTDALRIIHQYGLIEDAFKIVCWKSPSEPLGFEDFAKPGPYRRSVTYSFWLERSPNFTEARFEFGIYDLSMFPASVGRIYTHKSGEDSFKLQVSLYDIDLKHAAEVASVQR